MLKFGSQLQHTLFCVSCEDHLFSLTFSKLGVYTDTVWLARGENKQHPGESYKVANIWTFPVDILVFARLQIDQGDSVYATVRGEAVYGFERDSS
jgi:hypothetical protein